MRIWLTTLAVLTATSTLAAEPEAAPPPPLVSVPTEPAPPAEPAAPVPSVEPLPAPSAETPPVPPPAAVAAPAPAPEPTPVVTQSAPPPAEPAPKQPALRVSVGAGGFNRALRWNEGASVFLARDTQPFSGTISAEAAWFPGAHFTSNFLSNLGVFASGDFGVGMYSTLDSSIFAHEERRIRVGGALRLPLGAVTVLQLQGGWGWHLMTTSGLSINDGRARPAIPDVLFSGFRGGLGLRFKLAGTLELDLAANGQYLSGFGELAESAYFPDSTGFALDAGGGLSLGLVEGIRLRVGAEWQRYFVTTNAPAKVQRPADSLSDQYVTAVASLQWVL